MGTLTKRCRANEKGDVVIPLGPEEAGHEVVVTVEFAEKAQGESLPAPAVELSQEEWRERMEKLAGSIDDPDFKRPPQPELPKRNWDFD